MKYQFRNVTGLLEKGAKEGVYPGCVLLVAKSGEAVFLEEAGFQSYDPEASKMRKETIFDLASLTKPLATTLILMKLVDDGNLDLDQKLFSLLPGTIPEDKADLTVRMMLSHSAGLADWKPYYLKLQGIRPEDRKRSLRRWILDEPLAYEPGEGSLYSDLGFMILEWVIDEAARTTIPHFLHKHFYGPLGLRRTFFNEELEPEKYPKVQFAPTEDCPWRKEIVQGVVGDENAFALGGYSGHAGLFGVAEEVYAVVDLLLEHYKGNRKDYLNPDTVQTFFSKQDLAKGGTWALGWDTPSPEGSSSGRYFSEDSVGHLGFTGTSVWVDLKKDVIVILLTNRIHPTRNNEKIKGFRPRIHDMIMQELGHTIGK